MFFISLVIYVFIWGAIPKIEEFINILFDGKICLENRVIVLFIDVNCFINEMKPII